MSSAPCIPSSTCTLWPETYLAVPKGTPCITASAIGEIARQISGREHYMPDTPGALHRPGLPRRT